MEKSISNRGTRKTASKQIAIAHKFGIPGAHGKHSKKRACQWLLTNQVRQSLSLDPELSPTGVIHRKRFRDGIIANTPLVHHRKQELLREGRMNSQSVQNLWDMRRIGDVQIFVCFEMIRVYTVMGIIQQWKVITQQSPCSTIFSEQEEKAQGHTVCWSWWRPAIYYQDEG